ncbi:MAG: TIGR01841 family phasin [Parvularculaceae bacterium]|nr:TIGR01841 family phasin [Parvularculaceae bacterium]
MAAKKTAAAEGFDTLSFNADTFKDGYEKFTKSMNSFADFQKGSLEAMMASASAYAKGFEKAASAQANLAKEQYEDGMALAKAASSSKSVQETIELQTEFARTMFERNLALVSTLAEHWNGVAKEASEPMTKRYSEFVEMVQSYRA